MTRFHCSECGDPIPNGEAHIRSESFQQVAFCDCCWWVRLSKAVVASWAA